MRSMHYHPSVSPHAAAYSAQSVEGIIPARYPAFGVVKLAPSLLTDFESVLNDDLIGAVITFLL